MKTSVDLTKYSIVFFAEASEKLVGAANYLKKNIEKYSCVELDIYKDTEKENDFEILVGKTSRASCNELFPKIKEKSFVIAFDGNKLHIAGKNDNDTILGIRYFISEYLKKSLDGAILSAEEFFTKRTGAVIYMGENYESLVLEKINTIYETPELFDHNWCSYAKIIKLENQENEENNGILLASNENVKRNPWDIYRSKDDGSTWEKLSGVPDDINTSNIPGYQPYLYELPADIGHYKKGTILFAGCTYGFGKTIMFLSHSTDLGESWKGICNVAVGRDGREGIWEPFLVYEPETKRLYCFYSDETDPAHNQKLVYRYTTDLENWSEICDMIALGNCRPGMIALAKMGNGKWAHAFELWKQGADGWPVYITFADSLDSWKTNEEGKLLTDGEGKFMISSPAAAWTPDGGDCGTLIVTAMRNAGVKTRFRCDFFLSFDYGQTFVSVDNPLPVLEGHLNKTSYSPGFYVDKQGSVYYANNPGVAFDTAAGKLMSAKLKMY